MAKATTKTTKKKPARRRAEPARLARVLFAASALPRGDQLRIAAKWRWEQVVSDCEDSTPKIANGLGVSTRHVQRLRVAFA